MSIWKVIDVSSEDGTTITTEAMNTGKGCLIRVIIYTRNPDDSISTSISLTHVDSIRVIPGEVDDSNIKFKLHY